MRVQVTPDRQAWAPAGFAHDYWSTVLGEETDTTLLVRSEQVVEQSPGGERVDGPFVAVVCLPPIRPDWTSVPDSLRALKLMWQLPLDGAWLLRMPGIVGSLALIVSLARRRPVSVQVVGDPIEVAFTAGVGGRMGKLAGVVLAGATRVACQRAAVASYVTSEYLQRRYPPGSATETFTLPNVRLDEVPGLGERRWDRPVARIVTVGSLDQPYKRVDLLLHALACLREEGWPLQLDVVGGGRLTPELAQQARTLSVDHCVNFVGAVPRSEVHTILASGDLFVLCSDTEGLPRALIEAMDLGLPCVGSSVGGIPELLPAVARFERGSLNSLVSTLRRFLVSPGLRAACGAQAAGRAAAYRESSLVHRRQAFADAVFVSSGGQR